MALSGCGGLGVTRWGMKAFAGAIAAVLLSAAGPAQARWLKAETERFIVYSDGAEAELREFATKLASFDAVLRFRHKVKDRELGRRLEVYLVRGPAQLQRIQPRAGYGIAGFYRATPQGVLAVAIRDDRGLGADDVLFHEYTHHFMLEYFPVAYPAWLIEGYAEYFSTVQIKPEGIEIGRYNDARAGMLRQVNWIFTGDLISKSRQELRGESMAAFYGQSWLLTHYMMMDDARAKQLDAAMRAVAEGKPAIEAMEAATGKKVGALHDDLRRYMKGKLLYRRMPNPFPAQAPMTLVPLPPSADSLLLESASLTGPMTDNDGRALLRTIRNRAEDLAGDELADLALARAEMRFGDPAKAETILNRRLQADPRETDSLRLMGEILISRGDADEKRRAEFYKAARPYLSRAFAADGADFRTLHLYARARSLDPGYPDENTTNILLLALQLAPSVDAIRLRAGEALLKRNQKADAIAVLTVLASSPHDSSQRTRAMALIAAAKGEAPPPAPAKDADEGG